mmetsp:Transcript_5740/g.15900  ORF Transcript_5740/g.15900 Transcript_5740/m.15900 type:complete len:240 (+) Transcript_5740:313-1032(+)
MGTSSLSGPSGGGGRRDRRGPLPQGDHRGRCLRAAHVQQGQGRPLPEGHGAQARRASSTGAQGGRGRALPGGGGLRQPEQPHAQDVARLRWQFHRGFSRDACQDEAGASGGGVERVLQPHVRARLQHRPHLHGLLRLWPRQLDLRRPEGRGPRAQGLQHRPLPEGDPAHVQPRSQGCRPAFVAARQPLESTAVDEDQEAVQRRRAPPEGVRQGVGPPLRALRAGDGQNRGPDLGCFRAE